MNKREIRVLNCILENSEIMTFSQIQEKTKLSKSTLHRILESAILSNILCKIDRKYYFGSTILRWINTKHHKNDFIYLIEPYLHRLSDKTKQTIHLVMLNDNVGVYIAKIDNKSAIQLRSRVGDTLKLYATGSGRALLMNFSEKELDDYLDKEDIVAFTQYTQTDKKAIKDQIAYFKRQGFAFEVEQNENQIQCIGASFYFGGIALAISITATKLITTEELISMSDDLLKTIDDIKKDLLS